MAFHAQHRPASTHHPGLLLLALLLALLIALAFAPAAGAAQEGGDQDESHFALFNRGSVSYQRYCGSCHGTKAKGDGQVARLLTIPPTDLTRLTADNDGEFPEDLVRATIDGRKEVPGHGSPDMPVFGQFFLDGGEGPEAEALVKTRIDELTAYLEGIQEK